jgi:hypothetical protein
MRTTGCLPGARCTRVFFCPVWITVHPGREESPRRRSVSSSMGSCGVAAATVTRRVLWSRFGHRLPTTSRHQTSRQEPLPSPIRTLTCSDRTRRHPVIPAWSEFESHPPAVAFAKRANSRRSRVAAVGDGLVSPPSSTQVGGGSRPGAGRCQRVAVVGPNDHGGERCVLEVTPPDPGVHV